ncbi:hypothetical protein ACQKII_16690 [Lysinibacillus sp. NPDC048646]|uniref:hypothetical protein n=1 Tax=Lysinibacillus sp. NPDC048646 TaxID=3390574 RepID=UPI003CFE7D69
MVKALNCPKCAAVFNPKEIVVRTVIHSFGFKINLSKTRIAENSKAKYVIANHIIVLS